MAQTAVEWLIEIQKSQSGMLFESDIEKAKELEKQQRAEAGTKNYKIDTLLSWLDAADQTNKQNIITSVTLFSDGSGRIRQEEKIVDDFLTIEEAFEKLETIVNTQKS